MFKDNIKNLKFQILNLLIGSFLLIFVGWSMNVMVAPWLVSIFLISYFRNGKTWLSIMIAFPVLTLATFFTIHGGWDISTIGEFGFSAVMILVLSYGSIVLATPDRNHRTVRIGSITVTHPQDYWAEIIDKNTPAVEAVRFLPELMKLENDLFEKSEQALRGGAEIIFWSEGNAVIYEDHEEEFLERASSFARKHNVYLMPGYMVAKYGKILNDNKLVLIDPAGEIVYHYIKTNSWYPTESDGVIKIAKTPFGNIAGVVCFDLDFPGFIRKAGRSGVDIMLVPAFDTEPIGPYHTEVGLFRSIENGFSVVRQVNKGTSTAVDSYGRTLAYQDYFRTEDKIMYSDVPIKGHKTIYRYLGDWLPVLAGIALLAIILFSFKKRRVTGDMV